jgi:hypothetical protein
LAEHNILGVWGRVADANTPQSVLVVNMPNAEAMCERIKKRQAAILNDLEDNETLVVEHHAPSGLRVNIREVGYFANDDDALLLVGTDPNTGEECQVIAATQVIRLVFRVFKVEGSTPERKAIGFNRVA